MADNSIKVPNLSAKLERLRCGLVSDTIRLSGRSFPSLKSSQLRYGLKSGHFGAYDPLRKRSKLFRQAVSRYAPPYYFWHKEFLNRMKQKQMMSAFTAATGMPVGDESMDVDSDGYRLCIWCQQKVSTADIDHHMTSRCKQRFDFLGQGFFQCQSCKQGFLDRQEYCEHSALHFPTVQTVKKEMMDESCWMTTTTTTTADNDNNDNYSQTRSQSQSRSQSQHPIVCRDQAKRKKWL